MYEASPTGLGWETLSERQSIWDSGPPSPLRCDQLQRRGIPENQAEKRCFKSTSPERTLAIQSGCERIGFSCTTDGEDGEEWCCEPGQPSGQSLVVVPEPQILPGDPVPVHQRSFMQKLMHPGAIAALGLVAVVGFFGYRMLVAQEGRPFDV